MTLKLQDLTVIMKRLEKVERQNRKLKLIVLLVTGTNLKEDNQ